MEEYGPESKRGKRTLLPFACVEVRLEAGSGKEPDERKRDGKEFWIGQRY